MIKVLSVLIITIFLAGCLGTSYSAEPITPGASTLKYVEVAQQAVRRQMKDPESTRFDKGSQLYKLGNGDIAVCGSVNAKNSYGGYTGYGPYYVRLKGMLAKIVYSESDSSGFSASKVACDMAASGNIKLKD
jgi:hypothetical protein